MILSWIYGDVEFVWIWMWLAAENAVQVDKRERMCWTFVKELLI